MDHPEPIAEEGTASLVPQPSGPDGSSPQERVAAAQERVATIVAERPEVAVGAAFAGGLLVALILNRVAR